MIKFNVLSASNAMNDNPIDDITEVDGIPLMTEQIAFKSGELVDCPKCRKQNPPNRPKCLYCGAVLDLADEIAAGLPLQIEPAETWEPGVDIVVVAFGPDVSSDGSSSVIAGDRELISAALACEPPFPLARVREADSDLLARRLTLSGLEVRSLTSPPAGGVPAPKRLRTIELADRAAVLRSFNNAGETFSFAWPEIRLAVLGTITETSSEARIKRTRKETKHVDERVTGNDHDVLDIYAGDALAGFRIVPHGFDFSALGDRKSLLAAENMRTLLSTLMERSPNLLADRSFGRKSQIIEKAWPSIAQNTSKGIYRSGLRVERGVGELISNADQFNRYSRMMRDLI